MPWLSLAVALSTAQAGPHKPLCDKVRQADLVFEMQFEQQGKYPEDYRAKQWAPPMGELQKTARTGKVVTVFKGDVKQDSSWRAEYGIGFTLGSDLQAWDAFFERKQFSKIYFLVREGHSYKTTGWAEESAGCGSSAHWSWCSGFRVLKTDINGCIHNNATE